MANETCAVAVKTKPALEGVVVEARSGTKNAFLASKQLVLSSAKNDTQKTDENGEATLTMLREASLINKDVSSIPHLYSVFSKRPALAFVCLIPNTATAKLADTIQ